MTLLVGWAAGRASCLRLSVKTEWWGSGVVTCLERGTNDLHGPADATATPSSSAPAKSRMVYQGFPGKRPLNGYSSSSSSSSSTVVVVVVVVVVVIVGSSSNILLLCLI